jgi:hypothetical protein
MACQSNPYSRRHFVTKVITAFPADLIHLLQGVPASIRSQPWLSRMDQPWKPVSLAGLIAWMLFYCSFLVYAFTNTTGFLFIDNVNLVVHEGGHLLFGWFGYFIAVLGGTLLQWLVPFLLAGFFFFQRETTAFAFCLFFFFENWLYTAAYMADARAMALPLVSVGDPDNAVHDWNFILRPACAPPAGSA